jgi:hypothetical protein
MQSRPAGASTTQETTHADVAWSFLDVMEAEGLPAAMHLCSADVALHVRTGSEVVSVAGRDPVAAFLRRMLGPEGTTPVRKKGLMVHEGRLAVMAAVAEREPVVLSFALDGPRITEIWLDL